MRNVDFKDQNYLEFEKYLGIVNDLFAGTKNIKNGRYLKKFQLEQDEDYNERLDNSYLYNYFKKTINNLNAILFRKAGKLEIKTEQFKYLLNNIDNKGTSLKSFLKLVSKNALIDGITYIWADATAKTETMTDKFSQKLFLKNIKRQDIINKKVENIEGNMVLTQITIRNFEQVYVDQFKYELKEVFYVINTETITVYVKKKGNNNDFEELRAPVINELGYIPVYAVYADKTSFLEADIPFLDLAFLNLKHYNETSNYDNIKNLAGVPVPVIYSSNEYDKETLKKEGIAIGVSTALSFNSKTEEGFEWAQVDSSCLKELRDGIIEIENKMESTSFSFLSKKSFNTATEAELADSQSGLFLNELVSSIEEALTNCFETFNEYLNVKIDYVIDLNKDFKSSILSDATIAQLINLKNSNLISIDTLWESLINGEIIKISDFDIEKQKIEDSANIL